MSKHDLKISVYFVLISLAISVFFIAVLLPYAKLPQEQLTIINTPQKIENTDLMINMGDDYGSLSVIELMGYYIDNPPAKTSGVVKPPKLEFGGC